MRKINLANHRLLFKYLGQGRLSTWLTPLFGFGELFFAILIPKQMAQIIDQGVLLGDTQAITRQGIYLVIMSLSSLLCGILASLSSSYAGSLLSANLRSSLFSKILTFSFADYDKFEHASLVTRLTNDLSTIQFAFIMTLRLLTKMPFLLILALIMTYNINRQIALIYFCLLPFLSVCLVFIEVKAYPLFRQLFRAMDSLNANVQENVVGIRVVKAFVREQTEYNKFSATAERLYAIHYRAEILVNYWNPIIMSIIFGAVLLVINFGGKGMVFGTMQIGELTSIMIYTMQIVWSFFSFAFIFMLNLHSDAARTRVLEVLQTENEQKFVAEADGIKVLPDASIEFKHVNFSYVKDSSVYALRDISFRLASGKSLGIIGATGSGKSSLVQLLARLYDLSSGQIIVGGHDIKAYDIKSLRDAISLVLQKNILFRGSIAANLRWGKADASQAELEAVCNIAGASEFIKELPETYDYELQKAASNLSGGQKQRICIARALLKNPQILILDDATSAVDTRTERKIQLNLQKLRPDMTKIIIAQRISSVLSCDYVLILQDGELHAFDTPDRLLKHNSLFKELYTLQATTEEEMANVTN